MAYSEPDNNNNNSNEPVFVDPNTDDLDAFSDLMAGRAKVKPEEEPEKTVPEDDNDNDDDDSSDDGDDQQEQDESEDDGDESAKDDTKSTDKPSKPVNRFQTRIDELTAKAREAERREAEVTRRLAELESKQTAPPAQDTPTSKTNNGPTPDDTNEDGSDKYPLGEFDPSYIRDLTRHTIQTEQAAANERAEKERTEKEAQASRDALQEQWAEKANAIVETHTDFVEKTMELESTFENLDAGYSDYLVQTIKSLDHGPEVLYHFANNLAEAQKFVKLGPLAATLALGEMNARFRTKQEPKPEPQKVSKAPTPPPLNKGSKAGKSVAADTDDLDAFAQEFFSKPKRR